MLATIIQILARSPQPGGAGGGGGGAGGTGQQGGGGFNLMLGLMLALVVFYIFLFRGQGRRKKEIDKMIEGLKKNDRVVTIGGIVGTVVSTKGDEVVLKVDESNNTKMTFVRKSIQRVVSDQPAS